MLARYWNKFNSGPGGWALVDQGGVSAGNFLTNILLARALSPADYGTYALLFGVILALNAVHAALVTYPLSVRGAKADDRELGCILGSSLTLTVVLSVPLSLGVVVATHAVGRPSLTLWIIGAMLAWQVQETCRRALMSHFRHRTALAGDLISFGGQAAAVWALLRTGHHSLVLVFAVMIGSSLLAAVLQGWQAGSRRTHAGEAVRLGVEAWRLGKVAVQGSFLSMLLIQAFPWTLAACYGASAVAGFQAIVNLLTVTNPVVLGIGNLIIPATARASVKSLRAAHQVLRKYAIQGGMLVVPYLAILLALPKLALATFYGSSSPYLGYPGAVRICAFGYMCTYVAQAYASHLSGLERIDLALRAHLFATLTAVVIGLPLTAKLGILGAVWGVLIANLVRCVFAVALSQEKYVFNGIPRTDAVTIA